MIGITGPTAPFFLRPDDVELGGAVGRRSTGNQDVVDGHWLGQWQDDLVACLEADERQNRVDAMAEAHVVSGPGQTPDHDERREDDGEADLVDVGSRRRDGFWHEAGRRLGSDGEAGVLDVDACGRLLVHLDIPRTVKILLPHRHRICGRVVDRDWLGKPGRLREVRAEDRGPQDDTHADE